MSTLANLAKSIRMGRQIPERPTNGTSNPYRDLIASILYLAAYDLDDRGEIAIPAYRWIMGLDDTEQTFERYCDFIGISASHFRARVAKTHGPHIESIMRLRKHAPN